MLTKIRQIFAIIGIVLLVGLYVLTLVIAFIDPTATMSYLMAAIAATIMIPVVLWFLNVMIKSREKNKEQEE
ncbi:MAG: hypothetical protein K6B67_02545 [Lachnospiraceae bacterium]|nr:hypothetical protein [Lachnospiraceae bacterium]